MVGIEVGIEVVFIGDENGRFLLTKGNRYFVDTTHNFGAENTTHVTLVDDLGEFITIRIGFITLW